MRVKAHRLLLHGWERAGKPSTTLLHDSKTVAVSVTSVGVYKTGNAVGDLASLPHEEARVRSTRPYRVSLENLRGKEEEER
jgi:hypothetical protein